MANKIEKQISEIHKSDMYGVFVELGVGHPLAQLLYEVPGASQTIEYSISPYSKEMQEQMFHLKGRSVSKEGVNTILNEIKTSKKTNTIFVSSFQLGEIDKSITHGWVGLEYKGKRMFYHLTIDIPVMSRKDFIKKIGKVCLQILAAKNDLKQLTELEIKAPFIDLIEDTSGDSINYLENLLAIRIESNTPDSPIYITKNRKVERFETLLRENNTLNVYKGSFNPLHIFHDSFAKEIADITKTKTVLAISLNPLFKTVNIPEVCQRIENLNEHGYDVLIFVCGEFDSNTAAILQRDVCSSVKHLNFLVGVDTLNRMLDTTFEFMPDNALARYWEMSFPKEKVTFYYASREGYELYDKFKLIDNLIEVPELVHNVSSTEIRRLKEEGKDFTHLLPKKK